MLWHEAAVLFGNSLTIQEQFNPDRDSSRCEGGFPMFALVSAPLERWIPLRRQSPLRPGWSMDVGYYALGCFVGRLSDAASMGAMLLIRDASRLNPECIVANQPAWL